MSILPILLIRLYQVTLGPFLGGRCRFHPTCSEYAIEAFRTRGLFTGFYLTARRLARCHPFGGHGYDPVPLHPSHMLKHHAKSGDRTGSSTPSECKLS